ncbi:ATP-binding protein [Paucisalibacillus globulus]|uniref:ATP-binding protein n=1 Tax=Paucisalibacillus globulus TaxID=351095 RepID=UPI000BB8C8A2|nr:ATP-binding protein [Paucisalibacillus globulus]
MKAFGELVKESFPVEEAGEKTCEECGDSYKLYKTPRGVLGTCKTCSNREVLKKFNIPTPEEYRKGKELHFIASFERVPHDLKAATVNSYQPNNDSQIKAKQAAIQYVKEFDGYKSMTLAGTPGLGKSHLAYAISKAIKDKKQKSLFIKVTDLFDHIKSTYSHHSNITEEQIFTMINNLDLLVLDDIGSEYVKSNDTGHETWASDVLYKIFDMRLTKATVCTTNYSESELIKKYGNNGPRIMSRMMNNAVGIRLEGEDHRRKERF